MCCGELTVTLQAGIENGWMSLSIIVKYFSQIVLSQAVLFLPFRLNVVAAD